MIAKIDQITIFYFNHKFLEFLINIIVNKPLKIDIQYDFRGWLDTLQFDLMWLNSTPKNKNIFSKGQASAFINQFCLKNLVI
jgi:hypothetical protein